MDLLPKTKETHIPSSLGRLSRRLQRIDRIINPGYHPYPRPSSRSPYPLLAKEAFSSITTSPRSQSMRTHSITTLEQGISRPAIRRVASVALINPPRPSPLNSEPATPSHQSSSLASNLSDARNTAPTLKRAESFNLPQSHFKRAPSFNSSSSLRSLATVASALACVGDVKLESQTSDDEEKGRQLFSRIAKTGSTASVSKGVTQSPKTPCMRKAESPAIVARITPKDGKTVKLRPRRLELRRSPSFLGNELPFVPAQEVDESKMPFPADRELSVTPPDSPMQPETACWRAVSTVRAATQQRPKLHIDTQNQNHGVVATNQRTLRRSRMVAFPARRISFSNFAVSSEAQASGTGLQSAIQLP